MKRIFLHKYALPVLLVIVLIIWELIIYTISVKIANSSTSEFQLAARYSARSSFALLAIILFWIGSSGLISIYKNISTKNLFIITLFLLMVNHLIHFGYLFMNYSANNKTLLQAKNVAGALAYLMLLAAPWYLCKNDKLTRNRYKQIIIFLAFISLIFIATYIGRLTNHTPVLSSIWLYAFFLSSITLLLSLTLFRAFKEIRTLNTSNFNKI